MPVLASGTLLSIYNISHVFAFNNVLSLMWRSHKMNYIQLSINNVFPSGQVPEKKKKEKEEEKNKL